MFNRKRKRNIKKNIVKFFQELFLYFLFEILKNIECLWKINIKEKISYYRTINFNLFFYIYIIYF